MAKSGMALNTECTAVIDTEGVVAHTERVLKKREAFLIKRTPGIRNGYRINTTFNFSSRSNISSFEFYIE